VSKTQSVDAENDASVSVVIPTFQRTEGLSVALRSLTTQDMNARLIKIIVVDNNPSPQERGLVEKLQAQFASPITYIHVAEAGLSNVRNAAMNAVKTRYVAFLDDDMRASPQWLSALIATSRDLDAGIVFGPALAVMPNSDDPRNVFLEPLFSRTVNLSEDGYIETTLGAGGCLLDLSRCDIPSPPFDVTLNKRGGEDDILFDHLRQSGTRVAWSAKARSQEIVPADRTTSAYVRSRNFGYGQAPTRIHASRGMKGLPGIIYFMAAGGVQTVLYGAAYVATAILNKPASVKYLALAARGLGKVFWGNRFSLELYGKIRPSATPPLQK
jgi:glycosyltransferase involved in cell wall biosynthesis